MSKGHQPTFVLRYSALQIYRGIISSGAGHGGRINHTNKESYVIREMMVDVIITIWNVGYARRNEFKEREISRLSEPFSDPLCPWY